MHLKSSDPRGATRLYSYKIPNRAQRLPVEFTLASCLTYTTLTPTYFLPLFSLHVPPTVQDLQIWVFGSTTVASLRAFHAAVPRNIIAYQGLFFNARTLSFPFRTASNLLFCTSGVHYTWLGCRGTVRTRSRSLHSNDLRRCMSSYSAMQATVRALDKLATVIRRQTYLFWLTQKVTSHLSTIWFAIFVDELCIR